MTVMRFRTLLIVGLAAALLTLAACTQTSPDPNGPNTNGRDSGSTQLAFGLQENEDGTVVALGTLERIELEAGFFAVTGFPAAGDTIAVIANPDRFETELQSLEGKTVQVHGTLSEEPSIRMAGPEITIESIEEITHAPDPTR